MISEIDTDSLLGEGSNNNGLDHNLANSSADLLKALSLRDEKVLLDLMQVKDKIRIDEVNIDQNNSSVNNPWLASASTSSEVLRNETLANLSQAL